MQLGWTNMSQELLKPKYDKNERMGSKVNITQLNNLYSSGTFQQPSSTAKTNSNLKHLDHVLFLPDGILTSLKITC